MIELISMRKSYALHLNESKEKTCKLNMISALSKKRKDRKDTWEFLCIDEKYRVIFIFIYEI